MVVPEGKVAYIGEQYKILIFLCFKMRMLNASVDFIFITRVIPNIACPWMLIDYYGNIKNKTTRIVFSQSLEKFIETYSCLHSHIIISFCFTHSFF